MRQKEELLAEVKEAIDSGAMTRHDIEQLFGAPLSASADHTSAKKFSVVQSLFYVTGIVLFCAVLSVIVQTWDGGTVLHLSLTVVMGSAIWLVAYSIGKSQQASDTQRGLADALLLTGSLLMITGGYIVTNLFGEYGTIDFFEAVPALVVLAAIHVGLWYIVRRDLPYLISIFLGVAAVGGVVFGMLRDADATGDAWAIAVIGLAGLLAWTTRVLAHQSTVTVHLAASYDKFAIVLALLAMYIASFGDYSWLWYVVLGGAISGAYYLSIVSRQRVLLGTASIFLVLVTITLSFRYFSAFGVTTSLVLSALAILGAAMLAARLSKQYLS